MGNSKHAGKNASPGHRAIATLRSYLQESSVHGLRYLMPQDKSQEPASFLQLFFWLCTILTAFSLSGFILYNSFREANEFPIITTVDSLTVQEVPFPAVTINAGNVLNPWGFVEKMFSLVDYECYETPYDCSESKENVRKDLDFLINKVVREFFGKVFNKLKAKSLPELKHYRDNKVWQRTVKRWSDQFDETTAMLALIMEMKRSRGHAVYNKLVTTTVADFAKFTPTKYSIMKEWPVKRIYPIIKAEANNVNISSKHLITCQGNLSICPEETISEAYSMLLLPFAIYRAPFKGLNIGEFISYFSETILASNNLFLNQRGDKNSKYERKMAQFLTDFANKLTLKKLNITPNELAKLHGRMFIQRSMKTTASPYYADNFNCSKEEQVKPYKHSWWSYIYSRYYHFTNYHGTVWEIPCTNKTMVEILGIQGCCAMDYPFRREHETILMLLKLYMQPPHYTESIAETEKDFRDVKDALPYPLKPLSELRHMNPRMIECSQGEGRLSYHSFGFQCQFFRSYTSEGFGYTFNGRRFWNKHLVGNQFNKIFYEQMAPLPVRNDPDVMYPTSSGLEAGLSIKLALNKYEKVIKASPSTQGPTPMFKVTVHDPYSPPDPRSEGVEVTPGHISTLLITPSQINTTESVKSLPVQKRKCKFRSENDDMKIFSYYTQSGCMFECSLGIAADKCGCIPWNYPRFDPMHDVCDYMGAECFEHVRHQ